MRAAVFNEPGLPLELTDREVSTPQAGELFIRLKAAALNRRDYWITQGMYPGLKSDVIQGSDGAGIVEAVGSTEDADWLGEEVIINPGLNWGEDQEVQSTGFHILGMPQDGTFAQAISVPVENVFLKPSHLDWQEAAALPLAGVTAFRAVTRGQVTANGTVLITGIGGGVANMALKFCVALGAKVLVTSSSPEKIEKAVELGATAGFLYSESGWEKRVSREYGPVSLILDGAGGPGYFGLLLLAAPGGRVVNYGATAGVPDKLDLFKVFWKQLRLIGTTMGSSVDFQNMLACVEEFQIVPSVDTTFSLETVNQALQHMQSASQFGKIVLAVE